MRTDSEFCRPDFGYNNSVFFKTKNNTVIGLGEFEGIISTPEEVESWIFNEFTKEAYQLRTKAINFRIKSRINLLKKLKQSVSNQIDIIESENNIIKNHDIKTTNYSTKKSSKRQ
jgi:hypothetical protein